MKRLLLLFIPLVFFFSCEKDNPDAIADSNSDEGCNCGEVVDYVSWPSFDGVYIPDLNDEDNDGDTTDVIVVGAHAAYGWPIVQMNCSEEMISLCDELEMGDVFCFDYVGDCYFAECRWTESVPFFEVIDSVITPVIEDMLLQNITIDGGYLVVDYGFSTDTIPYDCE